MRTPAMMGTKERIAFYSTITLMIALFVAAVWPW